MELSSSSNGFMTSIWGPAMWHSLHTISFNYPLNPSKKQKEQYKKFILSLEHVLPCGICRENFPRNLKMVPLTPYALQNRNTFSRWMYRFHKHINSALGKPTSYTYEEIRQTYETFRAKCVKKKRNKKENGCVLQNTQIPQKCIFRIVPKTMRCPVLSIEKN